MRGSEKLKNIHKLNQETMMILLKTLAIYNVMTGMLYFFKRKSILSYAILSFFEPIAVFLIRRFTRPVIVKENGVEKLESVASINSSGVLSFIWDSLAVSIIVKFLFVFGWAWLLLYLAIPLSFFFEFMYKPYKKLKGE